MILESKNDLDQEYAKIDTRSIKSLYDRANSLIPNVQVTFEECVKFHNKLIDNKVHFITKELPDVERRLESLTDQLKLLRDREYSLTLKIQKAGVTEELERIVTELNKQFERKGNLEEQKRLWEVSNIKLDRIDNDLRIINSDITSNDELITSRVTQFNRYFTRMSEILYGENYILTPIPKERI